jgi:hypothetical protein
VFAHAQIDFLFGLGAEFLDITTDLSGGYAAVPQ